ncbi:hypothetical protein NBH00_10865 [Paraconexibacter antarcticus]|uniref:Alpha/beta hydrolase family protein n=1 Tax=Paraconexibacter antarcticus TaxID=2949664 RepID=A0ABY5DYD4_9ACTN|nr:hypothetical protein [Paraconexibacter antarcticus]UTI66686.1 hypothetical protein NBH00_10865 [Paraconexibacter antarcticus]
MTARRRGTCILLTLATLALPAAASAAPAGDPLGLPEQAANIALSTTRGADLSPGLEAQVLAAAARQTAGRAEIASRDPERAPNPNPCTLPIPVCVADPRLDHWADGKGIVEPVLFTARDGATLSGHVWATRRGPRHRPGIVIVNGSIVGFEQAYWWAAQALAKSGYVVLTFDAQGEGASDQFGAAPDRFESLIAGTPPVGDGGPFYDGGEDALDFLLSTPAHPYVPRPSRTTGTSHADKQRRRVAAGLDAANNPLWRMLDPGRIGIAGHSYGAEAAGYLGQADPRIDAVVAWDTLCVPRDSTSTENAGLFTIDPANPAGLLGIPFPRALTGLPPDCVGAPPGSAPDVPLTKPALGLSGDYLLDPAPFLERPNPEDKAQASVAYTKAGVDSANIVVRGANHLDWSWVAYPVGTLRGVDLGAWYTVAWFDKYLKHDPTADARLLTDRWRHDARGAAHDPARDANLLSRLYRSRIAIHTRAGRAVACEDLRAGCRALRPAADDCGPAFYGYLRVATHADDGTNPNLGPCTAGAVRRPSLTLLGTASARRIISAGGVSVRVGGTDGPLTRVTLTLRTAGGRTVASVRRARLAPGGSVRLRLHGHRTVYAGSYRLRLRARGGSPSRAVDVARSIRLRR